MARTPRSFSKGRCFRRTLTAIACCCGRAARNPARTPRCALPSKSRKTIRSVMSLRPGEICDFVQAHGITGFATVSGDRHSFWAGSAAKSLPPKPFEPVGVGFVTGSISTPGLVEAFEHVLPTDHPLRALYVGQAPNDRTAQPTVNMLLHHGVRSCLEYAKSGDIAAAGAKSNPDLAPHHLRRHGRSRLCCCSRHQRRYRNGIRLHSSSTRTQRTPGRRRARLPRPVPRPVVAKRKNAKARNANPGRRSKIFRVMHLIVGATICGRAGRKALNHEPRPSRGLGLVALTEISKLLQECATLGSVASALALTADQPPPRCRLLRIASVANDIRYACASGISSNGPKSISP
jgi:hypothetical protein